MAFEYGNKRPHESSWRHIYRLLDTTPSLLFLIGLSDAKRSKVL